MELVANWWPIGVLAIAQLAYIGVSIYAFARTRSWGFVLLLIHGGTNLLLMILWRFLPALLIDRYAMSGQRVAMLTGLLSAVTGSITIGLLIGAVCVLVRDFGRVERGELLTPPPETPFSYPTVPDAPPYAPAPPEAPAETTGKAEPWREPQAGEASAPERRE